MLALFSLLVLIISASSQLISEDNSSIFIASILFLIDTTALPLTAVFSSYNNSTEHIEYSQWLIIYHRHYSIHAIWIVATSILLSITAYVQHHDIIPSHYRRNMMVAYLVGFLFVLMSANTWIAAQHFSLAMLVATTTVPTAIVLYSITVQLDQTSDKEALPPTIASEADLSIVRPDHHRSDKSIKDDRVDCLSMASMSHRNRYVSTLLAASMVRCHSLLSNYYFCY